MREKKSKLGPSLRHPIRNIIWRVILTLLCLITLGAGIDFFTGGTWQTSAAPPLQEDKASKDGVWQYIDEASIASKGQRMTIPRAYRTVRLNSAALTQLLNQAPMEFTEAAKRTQVEVALPMPDGTFPRFHIEESPIMEPSLAAQFPEIKSYRGQGIDDPAATTRFDWSPTGFHAIVLSPEGSVYIDPYAKGDTTNYISYYKRDFRRDSEVFRCLVSEASKSPVNAKSGDAPLVANGGTLRTYRLAVAATGEYTTFQGGTVALALSAINTTMNRVNGIYDREVSVRMVLIANETNIIYTNAATDPYTNGNANVMIGENQSNVDSVIGSANYDIGHVFGTNSGGLAGLGVVCSGGNKGRGVTGSSAPVGDSFDVDYVAHEMGHQFGGNHTFNGSTGSCGGNRAAGAAYEPGSGSTIMAYAGICGSEDLQPNSNDYFHVKSLEEIVAYVTVGGGSGCAVTSATGNTIPTVNAGANFTIPRSTPFVLTAAGSDPNGDTLTYCWEEYDLGAQSPPNTDSGNRPIFRSFNPTTNSARTFPRLSNILTNTTSFGESLPITNRIMSFQVTARDNRSGGGAVNSATMQVNVISGSGPFAVTQPNTNLVWTTNSSQTVTWSVAGTSAAPVNCANVKITLSTDGGNTFPIVIAPSTPNDGSEAITVPNASTTLGRIKVEAVGNIFFDISNTNFTINAPPVITCPPNITRSTDPNQCSAVVSFTVTATDDMPGVTVSCLPPSGTAFPKGATTVNCTATDSLGATATCNFSVSVVDTQAPTIICPPNITAVTPTPGGPCATVNFTVTATDNCPGVTFSCTANINSVVTTITSPFCFPRGTTAVTCKATDTSGNMNTCAFVVAVFDVRLQDDTNLAVTILWNSVTGEYRFCGCGTSQNGTAAATRKGSIFTLDDNSSPRDHRVLARCDGSSNVGSASLQRPPGSTVCTIADRNITNDSTICP